MNLSLKRRIKNNEITMGSWLSLSNVSLAEIYAKSGLDWVVIDLEHSVISISEAADLIRVIHLCGSTPIVRLTSNNPDQIKRVMDAGAYGIIVPMVKTTEDAKAAVSATRYEPMGNRGVGLARAQSYGPGFQQYFEWQKEDSIVIAQIEHIDAVDNVDAILDVAGIDGLIIGPYDLSASMKIPGNFDDSHFLAAINSIKESGLRKKKLVGIHVVEPDEDKLKVAIRDGFNFIAFSVDIRILDSFMRRSINTFRKFLK